jgi:drug/metabolite transporter (DMT)-like permease|uniref:DMT family transporter n=1 Tax=Fluviicola sp. TaxID=1917219 RepID=UPI00404AAB04
MEKKSNNLLIAMLISMVIWGISWPSNHVLTQFGTPIDLGVMRYFLVIISLFIVLIVIKTPFSIVRKGIPTLVISGVLMAVYNFTFLQGLREGTAGAGGILVTTLNPIVAYGIGMLLSLKKPSKNETIGLVLGVIAGLIMLKIWSNGSVFTEGGNTFFLLSAFIWAIMSKFTSRAKSYGNPFAFTWWMYVVTIGCLIPFMNVQAITTLIDITELRFWGNLLFGSIISTTFATTMYFYATSKIGAEKASSFIFIVPFTAAISAFFIQGEALQIHTIIGGIFGIGAVWMLNKK